MFFSNIFLFVCPKATHKTLNDYYCNAPWDKPQTDWTIEEQVCRCRRILREHHATQPWKTRSKPPANNRKVSFFNKLRSETSHSPVPLAEQLGIKLNAFHKRELPSHLRQLVASRTERQFFREPNKKTKTRERSRWGRQKVFGVAPLGFTQQLLHTKLPAHKHFQWKLSRIFSEITYSPFLLKNPSDWVSGAFGTSCLHLFKIISTNSFCSLH